MRVGPIFLVVFVALMIVSLVDEERDPQVSEWLEPRPPPAPDNNLYLAIVGLGSPSDQSPAQFAHAINQAHAQQITTARKNGQKLSDLQFTDANALAVSPSSGVVGLCAPMHRYCGSELRERDKAVKKLLRSHALFLQRYRALYDFVEYEGTMIANFAVPFPNFSPFIQIQKLHLTQTMNMPVMDAQEAFKEELKLGRFMLLKASSLIEKMIAAAHVTQTLHFVGEYIEVLDQAKLTAFDAAQLLHPFTLEERSMAKSLRGEFRFTSTIFTDDSYIVSELPWSGFAVLLPVVFKRHASLNHFYQDTKNDLVRFDLEDLKLVAERLRAAREGDLAQSDSASTLEPFLSWPFNPVGEALLDIARPSSWRYFATMADLEGLRRLVLAKLELKRGKVTESNVGAALASLPATLRDPYTDTPLKYDQARGVLSFNSAVAMLSSRPLEEGQHHRWELAFKY